MGLRWKVTRRKTSASATSSTKSTGTKVPVDFSEMGCYNINMELGVSKEKTMENFWDLGEHFSSESVSNVTTDWEGMTSDKQMRREIGVIKGMDYLSEMGKDLILHMAYMSRDQAVPFTNRDLENIGAVLGELLGSRHWMKSGVKW